MNYSEFDAFMRRTGLYSEPAFDYLHVMTSSIPSPDGHTKILGLFYPEGDEIGVDFGELPPSTMILPEDCDEHTVLHELGHRYHTYYHNDLSEDAAEDWRKQHEYLLGRNSVINRPTAIASPLRVRVAPRFATQAVPNISQQMAAVINNDVTYGINPSNDIAVEGAKEGLSAADIAAIQTFYGYTSTITQSVIIQNPYTEVPQGQPLVFSFSGFNKSATLTFQIIGNSPTSPVLGTISCQSDSNGNGTYSIIVTNQPGNYILLSPIVSVQALFSILPPKPSNITVSTGIKINYFGNYVTAVPPGGVFDLEVTVNATNSKTNAWSLGVTIPDYSSGLYVSESSGVQIYQIPPATVTSGGTYNGNVVHTFTFSNLRMGQVSTQTGIALWSADNSSPSSLTIDGAQNNTSDWTYIGFVTVNINTGTWSIPSDYQLLYHNQTTQGQAFGGGDAIFTAYNFSLPSLQTLGLDYINNTIVAGLANNLAPQAQLLEANVYLQSGLQNVVTNNYIITVWSLPNATPATYRGAATLLGALDIVGIIAIGLIILGTLYEITHNGKTSVNTQATYQPQTLTLNPGSNYDNTGTAPVQGTTGGTGGTLTNDKTKQSTTVPPNTTLSIQPGYTLTNNSGTGSTAGTINIPGYTINTQSTTGTDWTQVAKYAAIGLGVIGGALVISNIAGAFKK